MLICVGVAWLVHVCKNHSWLVQSIIYGRWQSDGCFDTISRTNFEKMYATNILLAAFDDIFFSHNITNHVCLLFAFHSSQTKICTNNVSSINLLSLLNNVYFLI